ncbi:hypothetical protein SN31241_20230 [Salmonella enterica subsp. enterica serovar Newport str. USMARC-S3124.1]|nr:hypothetical protein SN31241_20230 [Salmonella enterica subsp. enterica serovar Newport str. USMARC-S3124.1]
MQVLAAQHPGFFSGAGNGSGLKPGNRNQNFFANPLVWRQLDNVAHRFLQWPRSGPSLIFSLPVLADF